MAHFTSGLIAAAGLLMLGGCASDGYYGGMDVGYGRGSYYGPANYGYGGGYGGWYDDFYYPGSGYYVFDRGGQRHRWNDAQRSYWEQRRAQNPGRPHWNGNRDRGNRDGGNRDQWNGQRPDQGQRPDRGQWQGRPDGQRPDRSQWQRPDRGPDRAPNSGGMSGGMSATPRAVPDAGATPRPAPPPRGEGNRGRRPL